MNRTCAWAGPAVAAALVGPALTPPAGGPAAPTPPCTQPAGNCQLPDQLGHGADGIVLGATSDENPEFQFAVRDNFVIEAGGTINAVCWLSKANPWAAKHCGN